MDGSAGDTLLFGRKRNLVPRTFVQVHGVKLAKHDVTGGRLTAKTRAGQLLTELAYSPRIPHPGDGHALISGILPVVRHAVAVGVFFETAVLDGIQLLGRHN